MSKNNPDISLSLSFSLSLSRAHTHTYTHTHTHTHSRARVFPVPLFFIRIARTSLWYSLAHFPSLPNSCLLVRLNAFLHARDFSVPSGGGHRLIFVLNFPPGRSPLPDQVAIIKGLLKDAFEEKEEGKKKSASGNGTILLFQSPSRGETNRMALWAEMSVLYTQTVQEVEQSKLS